MDMREQRFGVEVEMTGLTREAAATVAAQFFHTDPNYDGSDYKIYSAIDQEGRKWKFMSDGSIKCQQKEGDRRVSADSDYSVEMVTPICRYEDIPTIQELLRKLRAAGAFVNSSCGVHIHVDAAPFDASKLRNLVNIVASKEDMIYKALQVSRSREETYCKRIEPWFLEELNRKKPKTMDAFKDIWYQGKDGSNKHYHSSRYHCLNLHSVFQKGTVEFRAFNGEIHAGKIKAYIQFCLAITAQALNQRCASPAKTVTENEKYSFRVWLLRLGLIGDEFKTARHHLLNHLEGNVAWRDPAQEVRQRKRLYEQRIQESRLSVTTLSPRQELEAELLQEQTQENGERPQPSREQHAFYGMTMSM
jgi:hypothetical protein